MRLRTIRNLPPGVVIPKDPPRRQTTDDLTEPQSRALLLYAAAAIPTTSRGMVLKPVMKDGKPTGQHQLGPVTKGTLDALILTNLVGIRRTKKGDDVWTPTEQGWELVKAHVPWLLAKVGYTHDPDRGAIRDEPEAVNPNDVDTAWFGRARERHADAADRRARARKAARGRRAA
jgi:hypothetical protein